VTWLSGLIRCAIMGGLLISLSGQAQPPAVNLDPIAAGRVAATLSDWQTISFFLMFLLLAGLVERWVTSWRMARASERLAVAIDKMAAADRLETADIKVQLALVQDALARWERRQ
jgi:hypothetical protein